MKKVYVIGVIALILVVLGGIIYFNWDKMPIKTYTCSEQDVNIMLTTDFSGSMISQESVIKASLKDFSRNILTNNKNKVGINIYSSDGEKFITSTTSVEITSNSQCVIKDTGTYYTSIRNVTYTSGTIKKYCDTTYYTTNVALNPTNDINVINSFVDNLPSPLGATCTQCGIKKAKTILSAFTVGKNVIVLLSDGAPNAYVKSDGTKQACYTSGGIGNDCYTASKTEAQNFINLNSNNKIYTIYYETTSDIEIGTSLMQEIANIGKGEFFRASLTDNLAEVYNNIVNKICTLTCDPSDPTLCTIGEIRCNGANIQKCIDTDGDTCGDTYSTTQSCATGLTCVGGKCVCESNECTLGQQWCEGTGYRECVSDNNGCTKISNIIPCSGGQICSGGVCGCPTASCTIGTKQCLTTTAYKQCGVYSGICPTWSSSTSCPTGQICENGQCKCSSTSNIGDRRCAGSGYQFYDIQGNNVCPSWSDIIPCPQNQVCNSGVCGCSQTGNNVGDKTCLTQDTYSIYQIQGSDVCPSWSQAISCPTGQYCSNGECSCTSTIYTLGETKCFNTNSYQIWSIYSGTCASWGNSIQCPTGQVCTNGICGCSGTCTLGDTKCNGNIVQECQIIGTCPQWVDKITCDTSEICQKKSPAQCYALFSQVYIQTKEEYSYNEPIEFTIQVQSDVPDSLTGVKIYPSLLADGKIVQASIEPYLLYGNEQTITFNGVSTTANKFEIKVKLQKDTTTKEVIKQIYLKNKLSLSLSNLPPNYVSDPVEIAISVSPSLSDYTLTDYKVTSPDGIAITPSSITLSELKFTPTIIGMYTITMTATSSGFTQDTKTIQVSVNTKSITISYYLDGDDISAIPNGYVEKGNHKLVIKSVESGNKARDLDNYDLYLVPPSGIEDKVKLNMVKKTEGEWESSLDFPLYESEYRIIGNLQVFGDNTVPPTTINLNNNPISFKTLGQETPPITVVVVDYLPYILWGCGGLAILIVLWIIIRATTKKKKQ